MGEEINMRAWIHELIDGPGGLHDFEYYELATPNMPRDEAVAIWTIKCLANPNCEGSQEMLNAINERRAELRKAK